MQIRFLTDNTNSLNPISPIQTLLSSKDKPHLCGNSWEKALTLQDDQSTSYYIKGLIEDATIFPRFWYKRRNELQVLGSPLPLFANQSYNEEFGRQLTFLIPQTILHIPLRSGKRDETRWKLMDDERDSITARVEEVFNLKRVRRPKYQNCKPSKPSIQDQPPLVTFGKLGITLFSKVMFSEIVR